MACHPNQRSGLHRMGLQVAQQRHVQRAFVCGFQHDLWREAGAAGLFPAAGAQAPAVAGVQAGKAKLGPRGGQIVADAAAEGQKLVRQHGADRVQAVILRVGVAAAIALPTRERIGRAQRQRPTKNVAGGPARVRTAQWAAHVRAATKSAAPA